MIEDFGADTGTGERVRQVRGRDAGSGAGRVGALSVWLRPDRNDAGLLSGEPGLGSGGSNNRGTCTPSRFRHTAGATGVRGRARGAGEEMRNRKVVDHMEETIATYDRIAPHYVVTATPEMRAWEERAMRTFQSFLPGERVLVPGCGDGRDSILGLPWLESGFIRSFTRYAEHCQSQGPNRGVFPARHASDADIGWIVQRHLGERLSLSPEQVRICGQRVAVSPSPLRQRHSLSQHERRPGRAVRNKAFIWISRWRARHKTIAGQAVLCVLHAERTFVSFCRI